MVVELVTGTIAFSVGDRTAFGDVFGLEDKRVEMATLSSTFDAGIGDTAIVRVVFKVLAIPSMLGPVIVPGNSITLFKTDRRTHTVLGSPVAVSFGGEAFAKPRGKKRIVRRSNIMNNNTRVDFTSQVQIERWCLCRHDKTRRWNVGNPKPKHSRAPTRSIYHVENMRSCLPFDSTMAFLYVIQTNKTMDQNNSRSLIVLH